MLATEFQLSVSDFMVYLASVGKVKGERVSLFAEWMTGEQQIKEARLFRMQKYWETPAGHFVQIFKMFYFQTLLKQLNVRHFSLYRFVDIVIYGMSRSFPCPSYIFCILKLLKTFNF